MKIHCRIIIAAISFASGAVAQTYSTILTPEELATQKQVLVEKYPDTFQKEKIIGIRKTDPDHSKIMYMRNGVYCEAFINSGRKEMLLVETDQEIPNSQIPAEVKARIAHSAYKDWKTNKAFLATTPYSGVLYRVDMYKEGTSKENSTRLYFDDKGQFHQEPPK